MQFANAIDQVATFIQGTGHQMELEAIRSRVRAGRATTYNECLADEDRERLDQRREAS